MKARWLIGVACAVGIGVVVAGLSLTHGAAKTASRLQRPLHLPIMSPGDKCPVSIARSADTLASEFGADPAAGPGPIYPILFPGHRNAGNMSVLAVAPSTRQGVAAAPGPPQWVKPGWFVEKVLWIASPRYNGPILIRGGRIDKAGALLLQWDPTTPAHLTLRLRVTPSASGWWSTATSTYVHAPGCYAYQVDGKSFSTVIVFRAVRLS